MWASMLGHVKWFADFDFADEPRNLAEILTPTFFGLAMLSIVVIGSLVIIDRRLSVLNWYKAIENWFESRAENAEVVVRIGVGMVMLLSWQGDALLVPELTVPQAWVGWLQFVIALLLILDRTVPLAGVGLIILYLIGIYDFGAFHMLDYTLYLGAGFYLIVCRVNNERIRGLGIPALYLTLGFSLCWVAMEKIVYPQWSQYILQDNPQLALGLDPDFFILAAAFVEFSLGYLLIIGLLERPLALAITLVFFTTTLIFGKVEVIGHTLIHACLIVFLLKGPGDVYPAPIGIHKRIPMRVAFAVVNFVLFLTVLSGTYTFGAELRQEAELQEVATTAVEMNRFPISR